jgi:hypothetical protein
LSESQPSTRLDVRVSTTSPRASAANSQASFRGRPDRELRGVVGAAGVAHEVEECRALQAERLGAGAHRIQPHLAEQHVRREVVARRPHERREVGHRERRRLEVLPDPRVADGVARRLVEDAVAGEVAFCEPGRHLDEQQDLADARRRQRDPLVDGDEGAPGVEVEDGARHLGAVVREVAERPEARGEVLGGLGRPVPRRPGEARPGTAGACLHVYQGRPHGTGVARGWVTRS